MRFEIYDGNAHFRYTEEEAFKVLQDLYKIEGELRLVKTTEGMLQIWSENDDVLATEHFDEEDMNCDVNPYTGEIFLEDETVVGVIDSDGDCRWEPNVIESFNQIQLDEITKKLASFIEGEWQFYSDGQVRDHLLDFVRSEGFDPEEEE